MKSFMKSPIILLLLLAVASVSYVNGYTPPSGWIRIDEYKNSDDKITFHIALKQNAEGVAELEDYVLRHSSNISSPLYGRHLSLETINEMVSPDIRDILKVYQWLEASLSTSCKYFGDAVSCETSVEEAEELFNVRMSLYFHVDRRIKLYKSDDNYIIPRRLRDIIVFVDGISNPLMPLRRAKLNDKSYSETVDPGFFTREVMMRLYNMSDTSTSSDVSVGAMEFQGGSGFSEKNLAASQLGNGVIVNHINRSHIIGINHGRQADTESQLDVQVMGWGASNATFWYEDAKNWIYGWQIGLFNRKEIEQVVSLSWGWNEYLQCDIALCKNVTSKLYVDRCNIEFLKIVARGTTVTVASGDAGSASRTNENCQNTTGPYGYTLMNAIYPGSSPWVLNVGATYIVAGNQSYNYSTPVCKTHTCAMGTTEFGVNYNDCGWTSGAGFANFSKMYSWQHEQVNQYLKSNVTLPGSQYFNPLGRAYPDIVLVGHDCCVFFGRNNVQGVDGTSCSTPIMAGLVTYLNSIRKNAGGTSLGFINPLLYKMYNDDPTIFNVITGGRTSCTESMCCSQDYGFNINIGTWSPVSGLGSPNVGKMIEYLKNNV